MEEEGSNLVFITFQKCHKRSWITTIAFSFRNGNASIKFNISLGETWIESKNKISNLIFKSIKNLCGGHLYIISNFF